MEQSKIKETTLVIREKKTFCAVSKKLDKKAKLVKSSFPTPDRFITAFNYNDTVKRYKAYNTLEKCFEDKFVTLAELSKMYNSEVPTLLLEAWIYNLQDFLNIGNPDKMLTDVQIIEIADLFYQQAYYLNIPELKLFFVQCRIGKFGGIYGGFNGIVLLSWLNEFLSKRMAAIQKRDNKIKLENSMPLHARSLGLLKLDKEGYKKFNKGSDI